MKLNNPTVSEALLHAVKTGDYSLFTIIFENNKEALQEVTPENYHALYEAVKQFILLIPD